MSVRIINGKVYKNGAFSEEELVLKEGKIVSAQDGDAEEVYDAKGNYVVPGFIDVHTHGGAGVDVNAADQQGFEKIGHFFATQGTTSARSICTSSQYRASGSAETGASFTQIKPHLPPISTTILEIVIRSASVHSSRYSPYNSTLL